MNIKLPDDELIPDEELADEWGCTTRTLRRYEHEPNGLAFVMVGGRKFRLVNSSAEWLARRVRRPNPVSADVKLTRVADVKLTHL